MLRLHSQHAGISEYEDRSDVIQEEERGILLKSKSVFKFLDKGKSISTKATGSGLRSKQQCSSLKAQDRVMHRGHARSHCPGAKGGNEGPAPNSTG